MPKPITHFVVRKLDNGDYQVHVEAGDGEYAGDFTIVNRALSEGPEVDRIDTRGVDSPSDTQSQTGLSELPK